jgi:protein-tyrosine-phosphatase
MAAAFFNYLADPQKAQATSAGTDPRVRVHPDVLAVMHEAGIDLSNAKPQRLTEELAKDAPFRITMGCEPVLHIALAICTGRLPGPLGQPRRFRLHDGFGRIARQLLDQR